MATLNWVGRDAVVDHHERVEWRPLREVPELACGDVASGNLIIQGDNLFALKALLPDYAGKVKCLYVDPPYNTGTEGWVYNDRVDSPAMREWLGNVASEPLQLDRRDRWLSMMYPRLRLSKELLSPDGLLAVSIDDREVSVLGMLLDEIFDARNRLACAPWLAEPSGGKEKTGLRAGHEYLLIYHNGNNTSVSRETRSTGELNLKDRWGRYRKGRELTKWGGISLRSDRPGQWYPMRTPTGIEVWPIRNDGAEGHWRWGREQSMRLVLEEPERAHWELRAFDDGVTWNGQRERWVPYEKIRDASKSVGWSTWLDSHGFNADATRELKEILGRKAFDTPKPVALIRWLVSLHADDDALVVDTFAGSGTTAQAVLSLNRDDGGRRRFILIEMEREIAREITAERVRRVVNGYAKARGEPVPGLGGGFRFLEVDCVDQS
jgi:adenine-specific DNA-methyltransferase